jgi:hypothetical protein
VLGFGKLCRLAESVRDPKIIATDFAKEANLPAIHAAFQSIDDIKVSLRDILDHSLLYCALCDSICIAGHRCAQHDGLTQECRPCLRCSVGYLSFGPIDFL